MFSLMKSRLSGKTLFFIFILFILASFLYSTTRNVPDTYPTIQAGIDAAINGDTVLVQPGTYVENINFNGKLITVGSLYLTTNNFQHVLTTIIDGNNDDPVVSIISGEDSTAVLIGFTITNGYANYGGGIHCWESSPSLVQLRVIDNWANKGAGVSCRSHSNPNLQSVFISGNVASSAGGGINCQISSNPLIEHSLIQNNIAALGAGIYCYSDCSPILYDVELSLNEASVNGGGLYCITNSNPNLYDIHIVQNDATDKGGGIFCEGYSDITIMGGQISGNSADKGAGIYCYDHSDPDLDDLGIWNNWFGGGIYLDEFSFAFLDNIILYYNTSSGQSSGGLYLSNFSYANLKNVTVNANYADYGGGISCYYSDIFLEYVTIINNSANNDGGGIYLHESNATLQKVTISGNTAVGYGGGIGRYNSDVNISNSILWYDSPDEINFDVLSTLTVNYSDIQGSWIGTGNINIDPLFVNPDNDNYNLFHTSPCIDTGNPSLFDPDGTIVDMGAFYFDQSIGAPAITAVTDVINDQGHSVIVTWQKSYWDQEFSSLPIIGYNLWEKYPYELDRGCNITNDIYEAIEKEDTFFQREDTTWVHIDYIAAMQWEQYSSHAVTYFDSTTVGDYLSYFFVSAHTENPSLHFRSSTASGYSVDNIAPDETDVYITQNGSNLNLSWDEVEYGSFQGNSYPEINGIWYKIYAGDTPDFICDEAHLIETVTNLNYDYSVAGEEKKFFKIVVSDQQ